jgi:hypothetical protein
VMHMVRVTDELVVRRREHVPRTKEHIHTVVRGMGVM